MNIIIIAVFVKRRIFSMETILISLSLSLSHTHTHTHTGRSGVLCYGAVTWLVRLLHGWCGCYMAGAVVTWMMPRDTAYSHFIHTAFATKQLYVDQWTVVFSDNIHSSVVLLRVFVIITILLLGI